ncbi:fam-a protein [Plasmodium chabaudi chabaudi]|uniref:Fam-a protein n=1 Tax=Plasmodium chabaudi chabaudi TaxID=31271 RepID=A0A1D3L6V9_PLACU|nr:fam-a protein [Plasmodium chabaudi chabaudi]
MNTRYIKIALALLSLAEYMQNIAFASEYAPATISSNEEDKQQLATNTEEVKEQLDSTPEEVKEQLDSTSEEVKEELSPTLEEVKEQLASILEEVNEQLDSVLEEVKEQEPISPEEVKEQAPITPEEVKEQAPITPEEAKEAEDVMDEALDLAKKHVKHTKNYKIYHKEDDEAILYFKRVNFIDIGKLELTIHNPDSYDGIVNMLWDPNGPKNYDHLFDTGSFFRTYNENLAIIQQHYNGPDGKWNLYCYALAKKFQLSEDETAIVFASSDMSGPGNTYERYENPIVEGASIFKPDIYSEKYIINGNLSQIFVNLMAFFIKKEADCVKITHISSIDYDAPLYVPQDLLKLLTSQKMVNVIKLREIFKKE